MEASGRARVKSHAPARSEPARVRAGGGVCGLQRGLESPALRGAAVHGEVTGDHRVDGWVWGPARGLCADGQWLKGHVMFTSGILVNRFSDL